MKKIISLLLCLVMLGAVSSNVFATSNELVIPENATIIEIDSNNFETYFDVVGILREEEVDSNRLKGVMMYGSDNVTCKSLNFINTLDQYYMDNAIAYYDENNELWTVSPFGVKEFISKSWGPFNQFSGIYDAKNNVLYYSSADNTNSKSIAYANFRENGMLVVAKYDTIAYGNPTIYKVTYMEARFKNRPYVTVSYDGNYISFDQKPVIENGRTLVPLRAIFEKIGATVDWDGTTQTVKATKGDISVSLTINNTTAYKNGEAIALDVPGKIINGRTLVPVRFIADCFGVDVKWVQETKTVVLTSK